MYPKSHNQFSNDEKAFIVDEAQKGNIIKASNVQYLFKQNNYIPSNVFLEDTYKKRVRIFSLVKDSLKLRKDSFEYNVELQFIKEKEKEIDSYKEHIDDDLRIDIGDKTLKKSKTKHLMRKFNYLLNLRNITMSIKKKLSKTY